MDFSARRRLTFRRISRTLRLPPSRNLLESNQLRLIKENFRPKYITYKPVIVIDMSQAQVRGMRGPYVHRVDRAMLSVCMMAAGLEGIPCADLELPPH